MNPRVLAVLLALGGAITVWALFAVSLPVFLAGVVIFAGLPINWFVVYRLVRLYRNKNGSLGWNRVLRERALVALVVALVVTLFAAVFVNNSFFDPRGHFAFASMVITRIAILMLAVPALYWLFLYRKD